MENTHQEPSVKKTEFIGWVVCGLGALFYCYEYLLRIQPSVMVTELMQQYHISAVPFSALVSLYYLAYTPMQAVVGVITDLYGPRYILTFAVFICALGSFFFGIADNLYLASVGRFLVGLGSAFAFVSALKLASIWLPLNRFALFAGLVTALGMIGGIFGDIGLTHLVATIGWKETIYLSSIVGVILIPIIWLVIRDKNDNATTTRSSRSAYKDTFSGLMVILRNPQAWLAGIIGGILYLSLSVFGELWGIPFLKVAHHLNANQAALVNSAVFFGWLIGSPLTGWISDRLKRRRLPLILGSFFSTIFIAWILYVPSMPFFMLFLLLFLFGICCSIEVVCFAVGRETSPRHVSGAAVSFINLLVMLGGLAFQPLVGKILELNWTGSIEAGVHAYSPQSFQMALSLIPIMMIVGVILSFILKESFDETLDKT